MAPRVANHDESQKLWRLKLDLDITIVGAGPYGLSIAAHLSASATPFKIFGVPLESWRNFMPEGMVLKSEPFASNLWDPGRRFSLQRFLTHRNKHYQRVGSPLSRELFLEYADWFRQNTLENIEETRVITIEGIPAGFRLTLADGRTLTSRRVVLTTGHMPFRTIPQELTTLPEPYVLHSAHVASPASYAGRDITIVGAGQSALETAALLHEAGAHVRVLARRSRIEWNAPSKPRGLLQRIIHPDAGVASGWGSWAVSELPRTFRWYFPADRRHRFVAGSYGPSGSWWLRPRVEAQIPISVQTRIESVTALGERVRLRVDSPTGKDEYVTDQIIAATGYRVDIDKLEYLSPPLRQRIIRESEGSGIPALSADLETSVPGLFIAGIASSPVFGPIMRFMYGAKHAAPIVANRLRATKRH
jgi:FAD-dependent urate hydroxylase